MSSSVKGVAEQEGAGEELGRGETPTARFEIRFRQLLRPDATATGELPPFARDDRELIALYEGMALTRAFDEKAIALQRTGRLGTYASSIGQEAVSVGVASAMRPEDVLVPSFREHGAQLRRGVTPRELFLFWGGDERGSDFSGPRNDFPVSIPVASHFPHAAGAGLAFRHRGEARVAVAVAGDGATSKGDFYESLNLCGLWKLPVVFIVTNNQWAISTPRGAQSAAETLAQKSIAAGVPGEQVDGNDVIAMRFATDLALDRARSGQGPTVIEALTYRLSDHTTADDASRYRDDKEVSEHWPEEPLSRLRAYLVSQGAWGKEKEQQLLDQCRRQIDEEAEAYLATPPQEPGSIFDHLFEKRPRALDAQYHRITSSDGGGDA
ncbi:MAG: pyruvate dehydrogenase (acetyl-transferring) E1 component subunit alpha [Deltaproteobacteria bacterium]|jgi:pyruvate dehydrogenase E1 component alpha subunit|nr:pyruvate dehydrogenase (acetyl-transferring) E1 component subunit alpha [Deltaproteobacteria bacterium]MBW2500207.1 pyruvate dehydrogenase (acetyl-transferring) E1 component subunit alpha [Deltaproteobacteria bacterium]